MRKVYVSKLPFAANRYRKNQKVFVQSFSGNMAAKVCGRSKGSGRWISSWLNWKEDNPPVFKLIEIEDSFSKLHGLQEVLP